MTRECQVIYLGECDYQKAYALQKRLVRQRAAGDMPDSLLLLSHPPVFTIGRNGTRGDILVAPEVLEREGIEIFEIDRGGAITYHGFGQLVGYPILNIRQHGSDLHKLLNRYEEFVINAIAEFDINSSRLPRYPGVWVGNNKICALGIGVSRWVSYHGFALNINPNLSHFGYITPCGIVDKGVTSMVKELGVEVNWFSVVETLVQNFLEVFNLKANKGIEYANSGYSEMDEKEGCFLR